MRTFVMRDTFMRDAARRAARIAALRAIGQKPTPKGVQVLLEALQAEKEVAEAAENALAQSPGKSVTQLVEAAVAETKGKVRASLNRILEARKSVDSRQSTVDSEEKEES